MKTGYLEPRRMDCSTRMGIGIPGHLLETSHGIAGAYQYPLKQHLERVHRINTWHGFSSDEESHQRKNTYIFPKVRAALQGSL